MTELVTKTGRYDLFTLEGMWVGQEAGTGQLLELDDLIAKAGAALDWEDFVPKLSALRDFLRHYQERILLPHELPAVRDAYEHAAHNQCS